MYSFFLKFLNKLTVPTFLQVGKDDADPAAVHAHGPGLGAVKTGKSSYPAVDEQRLIIMIGFF